MNNQKCEITIKALNSKYVCDQPDEVNLFILSVACGYFDWIYIFAF